MSGEARDCRHPRADHHHGTYLAHDKDGCRCAPCKAAARRQAKLVDYRTQTGTHGYVDAARAREHVRDLLKALTVGQVEQRSGVHRTAIRVLVGDFPGRPASKRITRDTQAKLLAVRADRVGVERHGLVDGTGTRRRFRALVAIGWPMDRLRARLGMSTRTIWLLAHAGDRALVLASTAHAVRALYDELSLTLPPPSRYATQARNLAKSRGWAPPLAWDDDAIDNPAATPATGRDERRDADIIEDVEWLASFGFSFHAIASRLGLSVVALERTMSRRGRGDLVRRLRAAA